jgi:hypothetical protein
MAGNECDDIRFALCNLTENAQFRLALQSNQPLSLQLGFRNYRFVCPYRNGLDVCIMQ